MIHAVVAGNLGKDAELREAGDTVVCSFSVASNTKVKGEDVTTWVRCSVWGKRGEALKKYLRQGTKVAVAGALSTREYEGNTYLEMRADDVALLGGGKKKEDSEDGERRSSTKGKQSKKGSRVEYEPAGDDDDDIPF